jgi:hypothetical protein
MVMGAETGIRVGTLVLAAFSCGRLGGLRPRPPPWLGVSATDHCQAAMQPVCGMSAGNP